MSKKKKTQNKQETSMSPEKYIRTKVRSLEIGKCYKTDTINDEGLIYVVVTRNHNGGKRSVGAFLIDKYCLGVKNAFCKLRLDDYDYEDFLAHLSSQAELEEISYDEAHNLVYGAIAFAEDAGIEPDAHFSLAKYFLEEDTDDIPLIEYEFGKDGKHFLVANDNLELSKYLPILNENIPGQFKFMVMGNVDNKDFYPKKRTTEEIWGQPYTYKHPEYPKELNLENPELLDIMANPKNADYLTDELIDKVLAMPRESTRRDLEQILLYSIGQSCDGITEEMEKNEFSAVVGNCIILLGEVGNSTSSLDAVLETMRQDDEFLEYHICDLGDEILVPAIYKLGKNSLDRLMEFMKESGFINFEKCYIGSALEELVQRNADRREEVEKWFKKFFEAVVADYPKIDYTNASLNDMLISSAISLHFTGLLPVIKQMYDLPDIIDISGCGSFSTVKRDISDPEYDCYTPVILDVHETYHRLKEFAEKNRQ